MTTIARTFTDYTKECTLWCSSPAMIDKEESEDDVKVLPSGLEVGLEDFLHIKMDLDQTQYPPIHTYFIHE